MQTMRAQASCSGRYQALSSKNCNANRAVLRARVQPRSQDVAFKVEAAISRAKKEEIVAEITEKLSSSVLVYGMRYKGVTVKKVESMRRDLPPGAKMYVTKNRLLRVAVDQLGEEGKKWEGLKGQKGDNAWIFADENSIRGSVEAYNKFFKDLKDLQVVPKGGPAPPPPTEITTIVLDGQVMGPKDIAKLEKIPTKAELLTMIARGIKANPTKIATAIAAVPRKLAYGIKALSELNDDKTMTVEQAVAAKAAAEN